jgi:hypothetical protein
MPTTTSRSSTWRRRWASRSCGRRARYRRRSVDAAQAGHRRPQVLRRRRRHGARAHGEGAEGVAPARPRLPVSRSGRVERSRSLDPAGRCLAEADGRTRAAGLEAGTRQQAFVDVVEGDSERERVPPFCVRNGGFVGNDVPVGEAESAPEELAAGRPPAGRAGTEQEVAANALRRRQTLNSRRRSRSADRVCRSRPSERRLERPSSASRRPPDPLVTPPGLRHDSPANRPRPNLRTLREPRSRGREPSFWDPQVSKL